MFSAYIIEGAQLVAEGHEPAVIEWAARAAGMVVAPLQVFDEVTLTLAAKGFTQGRKYGRTLDIPAVELVETMVAQGRHGKAAGQGFYDYGKDGRRLWSGLKELARGAPEQTGVDLIGRRLLGLQALEAARCVEDGVIPISPTLFAEGCGWFADRFRRVAVRRSEAAGLRNRIEFSGRSRASTAGGGVA